MSKAHWLILFALAGALFALPALAAGPFEYNGSTSTDFTVGNYADTVFSTVPKDFVTSTLWTGTAFGYNRGTPIGTAFGNSELMSQQITWGGEDTQICNGGMFLVRQQNAPPYFGSTYTENENVLIELYELNGKVGDLGTNQYYTYLWPDATGITPTGLGIKKLSALASSTIPYNTIETISTSTRPYTSAWPIYARDWKYFVFNKCVPVIYGRSYLITARRQWPCWYPYNAANNCPNYLTEPIGNRYQYLTRWNWNAHEYSGVQNLNWTCQPGGASCNTASKNPVINLIKPTGMVEGIQSFAMSLGGDVPLYTCNDEFQQVSDYGIFGNAIINTLLFLFWPNCQLQAQWKALINNLQQSIPLGYFFIIRDEIYTWNAATTTHLTMPYWWPGHPEVATSTLDITQAYLDVPQAARDLGNTSLSLLAWGTLAIYLIIRALTLFG